MTVVDVDHRPGICSEQFDHRVPVVLSPEGEVLLGGRWGRAPRGPDDAAGPLRLSRATRLRGPEHRYIARL